MNNEKNKFPKDWNKNKVDDVINFYENQTEDEAIAEAETAFKDQDSVFVVPKELIPQVRDLLAKHAS